MIFLYKLLAQRAAPAFACMIIHSSALRKEMNCLTKCSVVLGFLYMICIVCGRLSSECHRKDQSYDKILDRWASYIIWTRKKVCARQRRQASWIYALISLLYRDRKIPTHLGNKFAVAFFSATSEIKNISCKDEPTLSMTKCISMKYSDDHQTYSSASSSRRLSG